MWETYRWQILTACSVILLQAGLIALLLLERYRRFLAEMESRERMAELAHVNRFSTAGEMAASIAHEINQPLGAILNNVETAEILLKGRSPDLRGVKEIFGDIRRDNSRATEVIRRLRSYVTKVPFERKDFDLNYQIGETVKFLLPEARSRAVVLRSRLTGAPLWVNGDPIQLQQVFSNLILNALDAASDTTLAERAVMVETAQDRKFAAISIADTGPGLSAEAAGKIFDPFFSTKKHGMGMGLSIARTIVAMHNGQIEAENCNGAVFRVRLPLA
jgi:C4-dicarboxylate-specific signal transduction histidine kinase